MIEQQFIAELLVRALATASIVILVILLAAKAGPAVGGVIAGLPIVIGPGYFFLLREQPAAFVADAATGSLISLSATQIFLFVYIVAASRFTPVATLALAALAWGATALFLGLFDPDLVFGVLSFVIVTFAARAIGRSFVRPVLPTKARRVHGLLLLRGIAAGLLVGLVSVGSSAFGTTASGGLIAFPVGFSAIGLSLHRDLGAAMVARTAHASLFGLTSLAVFCAVLAVSLEHLAATAAFVVSLAMSCATTMIGVALTRRFGSV